MVKIKLPHNEVKFYPEVKSKTGLSSLRVSYKCTLSQTWSDLSRSLRVIISETRTLFHLILVLLSSTLIKQLTCNVGIISLIRIFGLDI